VSVCLSVCLSARISPESHARSLPTLLCVLSMAVRVLLRRGDEIPSRRGSFEGFFPTDNALYSIAFGTHTKTTEPIDIPFGMMTRLGRRYHVLDEGSDTPRGRGNFGGKRSGALILFKISALYKSFTSLLT